MKSLRKKILFFTLGPLFVLMLNSSLFGQTQAERGFPLVPGVVYRVTVSSTEQWTDTGYEVLEDQEIIFRAVGGITLQRGNPIAFCGPDGYSKKTFQQPIKDENIGALIGRAVLLVSIEVDEETGEETRNEVIQEFFIGERNRIRIPLSGRLFLGINEDLVGDNAGEFRVEFSLARDEEKIS
jgi:hypothetical protein